MLPACEYINPLSLLSEAPNQRRASPSASASGCLFLVEMEGEKKAVVMEQVKKEVVAVDVSLKQLSKKLDDFAKERDWEQHHNPRNLLLAMVCIFSLFPCL
jgi:hypothetical protein